MFHKILTKKNLFNEFFPSKTEPQQCPIHPTEKQHQLLAKQQKRHNIKEGTGP